MAARATEIKVVLLDEDFAQSDLESLILNALTNAGLRVESVTSERVVCQAVLFLDTPTGRKYVLALPSRESHVEWTEDIDKAKVCDTPASIDTCRFTVKHRTGMMPEVLAV